MFGFLNVAKPAGPTSHDIVAHVSRRTDRKTKVGHAGTLDPFAEGVLVLCVGPATRLAGYVQGQPKTYRAEITLGATSTTDDPEGVITPCPQEAPPSKERLVQALAAMVGQIEQVPPDHSAVHVEGRRAYKLARHGETMDLPARPVTVYAITLLAYEYPLAEVEVRCGAGTYIRSLARDLGRALGAGGFCSKLTRTAVGPFVLADAVGPDQLDIGRDLIPPIRALDSLAKITVDAQGARDLALGRSVPHRAPALDGEIAVLDEHGQLVCIATLTDDGRSLAPAKVFVRNA